MDASGRNLNMCVTAAWATTVSVKEEVVLCTAIRITANKKMGKCR
jgi:hypothetical protein